MPRRYNVGIIGYGLSAKVFHIPFIRACPRFELYAITANSSASIERAKSDHPDVHVYRSLPQLLGDPAVAVVVVATPPSTHHALASQALRAGKHVVVEKPFTPTSAECADLISLARNRALVLTVYQNRRWDADFQTLQSIVQSHTLGRPLEFETHFDRYTVDDSRKRALLGSPGTGVAYDLGVHLIDQALVLFGTPAKVTGFLSAQRGGGLLDACTILLHYPDGPLVTVKANAISAELDQLRFWYRAERGSYRKCHLDTQEPQLLAGMGVADKGFALENETRAGVLTVWKDGKLERSSRPNDAPKTYTEFYNLLALALDGERDVPVRPEEALNAIRIVELAGLSFEKGCSVAFQ